MPFSGSYDFIETTMHWPITHMVPPAEQALGCASCHASENRLAGITGIYMPGHNGSISLNRIGSLLVARTLVGVVLHGVARFLLTQREEAIMSRIMIYKRFERF